MRRDERLASILDAAAGVFAGRGYGGCTMRDVARACRISAGSLYRHVGGKADLYYRVQRRILEAAVASAEATQMARTARDRLRAVVTDHIRRVMARPGEAEVIRGGPSPLQERQQRTIDALRARYLALVGAAVDDVVRPKTRRKRDTERRTQLLIGMADRHAWNATHAEVPARPDRLATPLLALFLDGARRTGK